MKKIKKLVSIILILSLCITATVPVFANSDDSANPMLANVANTEKVTIDDEEYIFVRSVTDEYSRVTTYCNGQIIADAMYYFGAEYVKDNVSGATVNIVDYGVTKEDYVTTNANEIIPMATRDNVKYHLDLNANRSFALHSFAIAVEATLFAALFPGMGVSIAIGIVSAAVSLGLSYIYYNLKQYSGEGGRYMYVKRVVKCYSTSNHTKQIGKTWTGIQKKRMDI